MLKCPKTSKSDSAKSMAGMSVITLKPEKKTSLSNVDKGGGCRKGGRVIKEAVPILVGARGQGIPQGRYQKWEENRQEKEGLGIRTQSTAR